MGTTFQLKQVRNHLDHLEKKVQDSTIPRLDGSSSFLKLEPGSKTKVRVRRPQLSIGGSGSDSEARIVPRLERKGKQNGRILQLSRVERQKFRDFFYDYLPKFRY